MRILFATPKFIWLNCFFYFRCEDSSLARHLLQHLLPWHCPSSKSFAGCMIKLQTLISNLPWAKKRTGNLTRAWRRWQSRGSMELPSCFLPLWVGAHFRRSLVVLFVSQTGEITPQQATPTWSHSSFWPSWHPCTFPWSVSRGFTGNQGNSLMKTWGRPRKKHWQGKLSRWSYSA